MNRLLPLFPFLLTLLAFLTARPAAFAIVKWEFNFGPNYSRAPQFDPSTPLGQERLAALESAAAVVGGWLNHTNTVKIDVKSYMDPNSDTLARCGDGYELSNTPGFGLSGSVRNKILTGVGNTSGGADGEMEINFAKNWGFGDSVPSGAYDFKSTVMHELLHPMGFLSDINQDGTGPTSNAPYDPSEWRKFDSFLTNAGGTWIIDRSTFSVIQAWSTHSVGGGTEGVNGNPGNPLPDGLYFSGPFAMAANGGMPVRIFSPNPWSEGSSGNHLDDLHYAAPVNLMMEAATPDGLGARTLSPIEFGILKDLGYDVIESGGPAGGGEITGTNLGAIPELPLAPRDISFDVTGRNGTVTAVTVQFTLSPAHAYISDLDVQLIAPDGTEASVLSWLSGMPGEEADCGGPYLISDTGTQSLAQAAAPLGAGTAVPPGTYRAASMGNLVSLTTTFSGKAPNGKWLLRFSDTLAGDTGTVTDARLNVTTSGSAVVIPTVATATQSSVTSTSAVLGGNVTANGGANVTDRGIVWATTTVPTTANNKVANGTGTGSFSGSVTGFTAGTTVFVRAYAINTAGTAYGSEISFPTPSNNANLSALTTTAGDLTPAFAAGTLTYTASVPNATSSVTVTPTKADAGASIQARVSSGAYAAVTSGSASGALALEVGSNTIEVLVTAQNTTTTKTYSLTVTRAAPSGGGEVTGTNLGAIPELPLAPRDISFDVTGRTGTVTAVTVQFTIDPAHAYISDLDVQLIAPDGTEASVLSWLSGMPGEDADCGGPYLISDTGTQSLAQAAAPLGAGTAVPPGTYRAASMGNLVSLTATFSGKAPNGIWLLRFSDTLAGDTGTVTDARLNVTTSAAPAITPKASLVFQPNFTRLLTMTGGAAAANYQVQRSTALVDTWITIATVTTNAAGTATYADSTAPVKSQFYRFAPGP